ncbi:MAG TPA: DEAD/DEAH box helicase family protein, partial [Acidobacteriota bacterium]|nr:DEAD/DEAH box helicase family protein [Acidobacteriota bacterium]
MSLKDLSLRKSYDSDRDNILADFYVPALSNSVQYSRLAGFFSSTTLAVAAKGISGLIRNGGRVRLITGAAFSKQDIDAIKEAYEDPETVLAKVAIRELENIDDEFVADHVRALGWMVANKRLHIKIAIVLDEYSYPLNEKDVESRGIFHQKVGILEDLEANCVSFSGSENESAHGWQGNIEEFKVFRSWIDSEKEYFEADRQKFEKFWEANAIRTKVIDMPKAIEERLIEIAPDKIEDVDLDKWVQGKGKIPTSELRPYQIAAVESWIRNEKRGIIEMATGTGKTITALECLKRTFEDEKRVVAIISSPFIHLSEQWVREFDKINLVCDKIKADSSRSGWKDRLVDGIMDVENGISEKLVVLTTHNTFASHDFAEIISASKRRSRGVKFFLIVDEVHGIGAPERRKGLVEDYDYRLGLSATPKRWFDLPGTDKIFAYFNDVVFSFSLKDAINAGYLTSYYYYPRFTSLTPEEMEKYESETRKMARAYHVSKDEDEKDEIYTLLCIKRQKIIRNAANKLVVFQQILNELGKLRNCLIYCSPKQIRIVQDILNKRGIIQHKFTQNEGTRPETKLGGISERDFLIQRFSEGLYQALVSIRCLDEGVDVPPARVAIMLDNSGNPREYIQRRGRVLRRFPGKDSAIIHDIIVEPLMRPSMPTELRDVEKKIISKELQRYKDFAG